MSLQERLLNKVLFDENTSCWIWKGAKNWFQYGVIHNQNKLFYSHRISYEIFNGKIPNGFVIDHLCNNRSCINPEHLEAVRQDENVRRSNSFTNQNMKKTHCIHGHLLEVSNLDKSNLSRGVRACIKCIKIREQTKEFRKSIVIQWCSS